jgi:hypothetical protein
MTDEEKKARRKAYDRKRYADNREAMNAANTLWRQENKQATAAIQRRSNLKRLYGITQEEHDAMLASQGGECALCGSDSPNSANASWAVDHCHSTGRVRGILCHPCNTALGLLKDNTDTLLRAVDYLKAV